MNVSVWWLKIQWSAVRLPRFPRFGLWLSNLQTELRPWSHLLMKCIDTCQQRSDRLQPLCCDLVALIRGGNRKKTLFSCPAVTGAQRPRASLLDAEVSGVSANLSHMFIGSKPPPSEAHFAASLKPQPHASGVFGRVRCLSPHLWKSFRRFLWATRSFSLGARFLSSPAGRLIKITRWLSGHRAVIYHHAAKNARAPDSLSSFGFFFSF